jgi:hypothetical protein
MDFLVTVYGHYFQEFHRAEELSLEMVEINECLRGADDGLALRAWGSLAWVYSGCGRDEEAINVLTSKGRILHG